MEHHNFKLNSSKRASIEYLLHIPYSYDQNDAYQWPIILFLHASEERGNNLDLIKTQGIPQILESGEDIPFIVIAPQCPNRASWTIKNEILMALVDEISTTYHTDPKRIYLTGMSMGGYGTWSIACLNPYKFAAIAPICGGGDPEKMTKIKHLSIWTFHGAKDTTVPIKQTKRLVQKLKTLGNDVKFTIYPEAEHDSWTEAYNDPELYDWFLQHQNQ